MRRNVLVFALASAFAVGLAGCTASGASSGNFELTAERIGWYVGDTAEFTLNITTSLTRQAPSYTIDRDFAIEEIRFEERGANVGGDFKTRNPGDVGLVLLRNGTSADSFVLDATSPMLTLQMQVPEKLRDSEYILALELFEVGWVKSDAFRVDHRASG